MDELLYHLYLLELHWGQREDYMRYKQQLTERFPESEYAVLINDPYYEENARFGKHIEDSLYAATYNAYKSGDYKTIKRNCEVSGSRFPKGENRPKFMFFESMSKLRDRDLQGFVDGMRQLVKDYPSDKISDIAGMMVKGIESGRQPAGGGFDIDALLLQRSDQTGDETKDALKNDTLSPERQTDFTFILSYSRDSVDEGKLLYELSRFNFTNFLVRNFEITLYQERNLYQMRVNGFYSYDEAHSYEQQLFADSLFRKVSHGVEPVLISDFNLQLIGLRYTWGQYRDFFKKHYVPSNVKDDLKLDKQPDKFIWDEYEEVKDNEYDNTDDDTPDDDDGEWY